jgi:hypothetical protein
VSISFQLPTQPILKKFCIKIKVIINLSTEISFLDKLVIFTEAVKQVLIAINVVRENTTT